MIEPERMLSEWGIDASAHRPQQLSRTLCAEASAIFVMAPSYLHRVACEYGEDLADKAYLFADPFTRPVSLGKESTRLLIRRSTIDRPLSCSRSSNGSASECCRSDWLCLGTAGDLSR